eukprot:gene6696-10861_t
MTLIWILVSTVLLSNPNSSSVPEKHNSKIKQNIIFKENKKTVKEKKKSKPIKEDIKIVEHRTDQDTASTTTQSFSTSTVDVSLILASDGDLKSLSKTMNYLKVHLCDKPKTNPFFLNVNVIIVSKQKISIPKTYFCFRFQIKHQLQVPKKNKKKTKKTRKNNKKSKPQKFIDNFELYNYAVSYAFEKYLFFIPMQGYMKNSSQNVLFDMVTKLENDNDIAIVGSKVVSKDHLAIVSGGMDIAMIEKDFPILFHRYAGLSPKYKSDKEEFLLGVSTSGMLIRRSLFSYKKLSTKDYPTESDLIEANLCINLHKSGKKILYFPKSKIIVNENPNKKKHKWMTNAETKKLEKTKLLQITKFESKFKSYLKPIMESKYEIEPNAQIAWDFGGGSCSGWFNEATNFATALESRIPILSIFGKDDMCKGLPASFKDSLLRQLTRKFQNITVWISHKPPDSYPIFPYNGIIKLKNEPKYLVGRSMYESTGIPLNWKDPANDRADEIWVPSKFLVNAFINSGISASKVKWMPEPIDVNFYNPKTVKPLNIKGLSGYNFLSVFKWEPRKGPDFLLRAYFSEFKKEEDVTLYLLTYEFGGWNPHSKSAIERLIRLVAMKYKFDFNKLPKYKIINKVIPSSLMPSLYKTFNAFVLPTRGEGWGLPFMEAMTMGLPTIGTNWGGQVDFMKKDNSYLIDVESMDPISEEDDQKHLKYATPSIKHLRKTMRHLFENQQEGKQVGKRARKYIIENFSKKKLGNMVINRIKEIQEIIKVQEKTGKKTRKSSKELKAEMKKKSDSEYDDWLAKYQNKDSENKEKKILKKENNWGNVISNNDEKNQKDEKKGSKGDALVQHIIQQQKKHQEKMERKKIEKKSNQNQIKKVEKKSTSELNDLKKMSEDFEKISNEKLKNKKKIVEKAMNEKTLNLNPPFKEEKIKSKPEKNSLKEQMNNLNPPFDEEVSEKKKISSSKSKETNQVSKDDDDDFDEDDLDDT